MPLASTSGCAGLLWACLLLPSRDIDSRPCWTDEPCFTRQYLAVSSTLSTPITRADSKKLQRQYPNKDSSTATIDGLKVFRDCKAKGCPYNNVSFTKGVPECFLWLDNDIDENVEGSCIFCRTAAAMTDFIQSKSYLTLAHRARLKRLWRLGDKMLGDWVDVLRRFGCGPDQKLRWCLTDFVEDWAEQYATDLHKGNKTDMPLAPVEGWESLFNPERSIEPPGGGSRLYPSGYEEARGNESSPQETEDLSLEGGRSLLENDESWSEEVSRCHRNVRLFPMMKGLHQRVRQSREHRPDQLLRSTTR